MNCPELLLRREGDRRSDAVVKREFLATLDKSRILFVVADRSQVVEMGRPEGLICLQRAPGESPNRTFDHKTRPGRQMETHQPGASDANSVRQPA